MTDLKSATADTTFGSGAYLIGADSQSAAEPSIYSESVIWTYWKSLTNAFAALTCTTLTASTGVQVTATARTATADGTGDGTIADGTSHVTVTSSDANYIIVLPTPTPGTVVRLVNGGTGYELRSSDPATIAINGGTGAGVESAIAANTLTVCVCTSATTWICTDHASNGAVSATQVAA